MSDATLPPVQQPAAEFSEVISEILGRLRELSSQSVGAGSFRPLQPEAFKELCIAYRAW